MLAKMALLFFGLHAIFELCLGLEGRKKEMEKGKSNFSLARL